MLNSVHNICNTAFIIVKAAFIYFFIITQLWLVHCLSLLVHKKKNSFPDRAIYITKLEPA